jgi:hypothetical protein
MVLNTMAVFGISDPLFSLGSADFGWDLNFPKTAFFYVIIIFKLFPMILVLFFLIIFICLTNDLQSGYCFLHFIAKETAYAPWGATNN